MRKLAISGVVAILGCAIAFAGFDQYAGKTYKTLLQPTAVNANPVTNSITTGVDLLGLVGSGTIVLGYNCANAAGAIMSFSISTCSTTNGTYTTWTNANSKASWVYTNAQGFATIKFVPNSVSRYARVTVTPTAVTNGSASAVLVTE